MAHLYSLGQQSTAYVDRKWGTEDEFKRALAASTTLYIGNLSFYTTEEQIYELFSKCGEIKRIIMGLDRVNKTPCGFCFVEYYTREDAGDCVKYVNGSKLDDRVIRVDWDAGFKESRQFGRGASGGQVRDEYRTDYDPGRGGYGRQVLLELTEREKAMKSYEPITEIPRGGLQDTLSSSSGGLSSKRERSGDLDLESPSAKRSRTSYSNTTSTTSSDHDANMSDDSGTRNPRFRGESDDNEDEDD